MSSAPRTRTGFSHRALACAALAFGFALGLSITAHGQPLEQQREAFRNAWATAQTGEDWRPLAQGLESYPLYPYLEATALTHDLRNADPAQVRAYLQRWPDTIPADDLRRDELNLLAQNRDWPAFLSFYRDGLGDALTCDALQARMAQGQKLDFDRDLAALWQQKKLPDECQPVLDAAAARGLLTAQRIWARIDRAADAGVADTIEQSADWLPSADAGTARRLAEALRAPAAFLSQSDALPDTARARQALVLALSRLARRDDDAAITAWQRVESRFAFDRAQRNRVRAALALYDATSFSDGALARLAALPPDAQTDATREWRVRIALSQQDWNAALAALDALSDDQKQDDEWIYDRGLVLSKLHRDIEAHAAFASLATRATFFGFLAADRADLPYSICPTGFAGDPASERQLLDATPSLQRAFEWFALDLPQPARREWNRALPQLDNVQRALAADLAFRRGWYDRAVFAFASGDALRYYTQRFPLADKDAVLRAANAAGIDPAWAYAIIRAESAWQTDAHSGADARGLMQLLPGTAARVARATGLPYDSGADLYDPAVNIPLGTHYLAQLAQRYDGAVWLATAAYDAGPGAVERWQDARGTLAPDAFIATIPFKETREYVARVLAFATIYDWRLHGDALPVSARLAASAQTDPPRKQVTCIRTPTPVPPTASTTPVPAAATSVRQ